MSEPAIKANPKVEALRVKDGEADMRLDRWFRVHFPEVGYTYLQKLLRSGQVRVDSKRAQANDRLNAGAEIRVPAIIRQPKAKGTGLKPPPSSNSFVTPWSRFRARNAAYISPSSIPRRTRASVTLVWLSGGGGSGARPSPTLSASTGAR